MATACGGSVVPPEEFYGAGATYPGAVTATSTVPGAVPTGAATSGPTDGATQGVPGQPGPTTGATSGPGPKTPGVKLGSCDGFKNQLGITDTEITIASVADISGPVPNTFKPVHDAMVAFVARFNATSDICGRKLKLLTYDSALSAPGSSDASEAACKNAFAIVGAFSAFDTGGADITEECGQPDIRTQAVEDARQKAKTSFAVLPIDTEHMFLQPWVWGKDKFGSAIKDAAYVYLNAGASQTIVRSIMKGTHEKLGYEWDEEIIVDITGVPNWNAYANQLKSAGIKFVSTNLSDNTYKLLAAMKQADYHPAILADSSVYGAKYLAGSGGEAFEGAYLFTQTALIEEASRVPEMASYLEWLQRTGGDAPNYVGAMAWADGLLFVQLAQQLGGKLSRASLIAELNQVHAFNGGGIISTADLASRDTAPCATVLQVVDGAFRRVTPFPWTCGPLG
jgi:ABC-type branched-subunit amino acid transport system substrate-binding protein